MSPVEHCPPPGDDLVAYARALGTDDLDRDRFEPVAEHVSGCPSCLDALGALLAELRSDDLAVMRVTLRAAREAQCEPGEMSPLLVEAGAVGQLAELSASEGSPAAERARARLDSLIGQLSSAGTLFAAVVHFWPKTRAARELLWSMVAPPERRFAFRPGAGLELELHLLSPPMRARLTESGAGAWRLTIEGLDPSVRELLLRRSQSPDEAPVAVSAAASGASTPPTFVLDDKQATFVRAAATEGELVAVPAPEAAVAGVPAEAAMAGAARTALERIATALGGWLDQSSAEYAPAKALSLVLGVWAGATARDPWAATMRAATRPADHARLLAPAFGYLKGCPGRIGDAEIAEAISLVLPGSRATASSVGSSRRDARRKLAAELGVDAGVDDWIDLWTPDLEGARRGFVARLMGDGAA